MKIFQSSCRFSVYRKKKLFLTLSLMLIYIYIYIYIYGLKRHIGNTQKPFTINETSNFFNHYSASLLCFEESSERLPSRLGLLNTLTAFLQIGKTSHECPDYDKTIRWWGSSNTGDLWNTECLLIAITPRSPQDPIRCAPCRLGL